MFSLSVNTLEGEAKSLADYKGKAVLFVNTASQCGYTPQYEGLQNLYGKYKDRGLVVAGFPCNQFGGQEPGGSSEIRSFCTTKYGVKFPMFEKVEVNGSGRHPLYAALTPTADSSGEAGDVKWNFEKFLLHADGTTIERFRSSVEPESETLVAAIEKALPQG
ncbi:MAG: glutathione peroxidase [Myxococcota bacterium]